MKRYASVMVLALGAALAMVPGTARADEALDILKKFDTVMAPVYFEAAFSMTAHREDGTTRTYDMRAWKSADDKFRAFFEGPAAVKGQEILRVGDNLWVYMPTLKKAVRLASRDSFMGGDFNNADVLRVNYAVDYTGKVLEKTAAATVLDLKARGPDVAYDHVKMWVSPADGMPQKAEFYTTSGKMIRAAEYLDVKEWTDGHKRPARIKMLNMLVPARWSEMVTKDFKIVPSIPDTKFALTALGK
ncbi:MAG TPA: outer membrane lipoprotein-sorting protein [Myxococcota bacterium]|jgi:outer membrane lipoprotein-sorting protein|nr:outer membrane lipoprotein-sorting protein [Myxococcota bacterium]